MSLGVMWTAGDTYSQVIATKIRLYAANDSQSLQDESFGRRLICKFKFTIA